jgi:hypothetical protein
VPPSLRRAYSLRGSYIFQVSTRGKEEVGRKTGVGERIKARGIKTRGMKTRGIKTRGRET